MIYVGGNTVMVIDEDSSCMQQVNNKLNMDFYPPILNNHKVMVIRRKL